MHVISPGCGELWGGKGKEPYAPDCVGLNAFIRMNTLHECVLDVSLITNTCETNGFVVVMHAYECVHVLKCIMCMCGGE